MPKIYKYTNIQIYRIKMGGGEDKQVNLYSTTQKDLKQRYEKHVKYQKSPKGRLLKLLKKLYPF